MNFQNLLANTASWFSSSGVKVIVVLFVAWLITQIGKILISKLTDTLIERNEKLGKDGKIQKERAKTLFRVFNSTFEIVIWVIALITVLPEFGIDIAPLLAGAGLIGLAVGMGARSLIKDYISGIFILLEDHYRVGEEVEIGGTRGKIKDLNLRRTVLVDLEGTMHFIPNGQINKASNFSRKPV